ncbi:hypothetical protein, partial [Moraxella catarrhalis]|uniref:hypothetical protein n=1 Tax=Moraxella catarrhalis TaxID=480 RepID=UPI001C7CAFC8
KTKRHQILTQCLFDWHYFLSLTPIVIIVLQFDWFLSPTALLRSNCFNIIPYINEKDKHHNLKYLISLWFFDSKLKKQDVKNFL